MTALASHRRSRTIWAGVAGALVLVAAPVLGYIGYQVLLDSKAGRAAAITDEVGFPSTPTAMLAVVDAQQEVTALAVLVLAPGTGKGGTLVSIPTNASRAQVFGDPQIPVGDSLINSGEVGLIGDVESLSSVTLNFTNIASESTVAQLLGATGPLTVSLPNDVVGSGPDGAATAVLPAGAQVLTPDQVAAALTSHHPTQDQTTRLANVHAVWNGLASAVGTGLSPDAVAVGPPASFDDFLVRFLAGPIQVYNDLTSTTITGSTNPNKLDVGALDRASMVLLMAGLAPSAMIAPNPTLNFRIENPLEDSDIAQAGIVGLSNEDLSRDVVSVLLFIDGNVISVFAGQSEAGATRVPDKTIVYLSDSLPENSVTAYIALFGEVEIRRPSVTFPAVDIVIVLGRNYLDVVKRNREGVSTGTTTTLAG